jgi:hypothetical protein
MKAVLICGDRNWTDPKPIREWLSKLQDWGYDTLVEGECRGADVIARDEAKQMGFIIDSYPAQWDKYGKAAGGIRNKEMLDKGKPDLVVYFHEDLDRSKGTRNMVSQAMRAGIRVICG